MVNWTENREEVMFVVFGKEKVKPGQEAKSYIVEEGNAIEGTVLTIKDSPTYGKVYELQVNGVNKSVLITGKTGLNEQMGYGVKEVPHVVKEKDLVRITYLGMFKTGKGKDAYKFKVEVGN